MAQVDRPIFPPLLYRYRGIRNQQELHQELDAIKREYLWCSDYRSLNDPMEGFYEPASRLQKNSAYSRIARDILNAKRGVGICCFSDTHSNELMWTHYASNYSGLCVGYRTQQLIRIAGRGSSRAVGLRRSAAAVGGIECHGCAGRCHQDPLAQEIELDI